jgi:membrane-anchored protein YejM (alkaline phosphatase superfamily)
MQFYNIVWIVVDSVRRYHTDKDDRGRLAVIDDFATGSVEFLNCVTSVLSISKPSISFRAI